MCSKIGMDHVDAVYIPTQEPIPLKYLQKIANHSI